MLTGKAPKSSLSFIFFPCDNQITDWKGTNPSYLPHHPHLPLNVARSLFICAVFIVRVGVLVNESVQVSLFSDLILDQWFPWFQKKVKQSPGECFAKGNRNEIGSDGKWWICNVTDRDADLSLAKVNVCDLESYLSALFLTLLICKDGNNSGLIELLRGCTVVARRGFGVSVSCPPRRTSVSPPK